MKIAVDLDGVVFNFSDQFQEFVMQRTGKQIPYKPQISWNWLNEYIDDETQLKLMNEFIYEGEFLRLPLLEYARFYLYKIIYELGHEIIFITSRDYKAVADTFQALAKNGLDFILHFSDKENTKAKICQELDVKLLIEDRDIYIDEAFNAGIGTIFFNYNNRLLSEPKNCTFKATSWPEVFNYLER